MDLVLGIDGGGTGCRAALAKLGGPVLARAEAGPANINTDFDAARANILAVTTTVLAAVSAPPDAIRAAVLGLAGANLPGRADRFAASLPFPAQVISDALSAAHGALGPDDGIVAAIGTGSVFVRRHGGETRMAGGHGFVLGDEGSGAVLGRRLLSEALRAADGLAPDSELLRALRAEMGGPGQIMAFAQRARPGDFAALAPRLTDSADPAALRLLARAEAEVTEILRALQPAAPLPVLFLGGLGPHYAARLSGHWPQRVARGSGLEGALDLAQRAAAAI
jgi:glucosamine kinase